MYRDNTKSLRKEACMQQHLFEHFSWDGKIKVVTFPLSLSIKLILNILKNEKTTGDIPLKQ